MKQLRVLVAGEKTFIKYIVIYFVGKPQVGTRTRHLASNMLDCNTYSQPYNCNITCRRGSVLHCVMDSGR
jgi:hypothetical protein